VSSVDDSRTSESGLSDRRRARLQATADLLDLEAGRLGIPVLDDAEIRELLRSRPRIAVVGASPDPSRPSHRVFNDLRRLGYDCVPVNPAADEIAGVTCYPTVRAAVDATGPVGIVDVFRLAEACPPHAREAVEVGAECLWLQLGIASREAGRIAHEGGLSVVMNRCLAVEAVRL
jgi:predicted CoA-binding protein